MMPLVRGVTAIAVVTGLGAAALAAAGGANYVAQARRPDGPRSVAEWADRAVRPPGPLPAGLGAELFARYHCALCHTLNGTGAKVGPVLNGVRQRKTRAEIVTWLHDPQSVKPGTVMPTFHFTPVEEQLLADYLLRQ